MLAPQTYRRQPLSVCRVQSDLQPEWVLVYRRLVGERIRAQREARSRTQIDLSYVAGVDRTTYQKFESGLSDPHLGELALIAHELDIPLAELLPPEVPGPPR